MRSFALRGELNSHHRLSAARAYRAGDPGQFDDAVRLQPQETAVVRVALAFMQDLEKERLVDPGPHQHGPRRGEPSVDLPGPGRIQHAGRGGHIAFNGQMMRPRCKIGYNYIFHGAHFSSLLYSVPLTGTRPLYREEQPVRQKDKSSPASRYSTYSTARPSRSAPQLTSCVRQVRQDQSDDFTGIPPPMLSRPMTARLAAPFAANFPIYRRRSVLFRSPGLNRSPRP